MEGADIYQIAKNCRTSVEMIEKYYAAHIKTSLDAAAINVMRPERTKRGKKAIQNTQASPQPPEQENGGERIGLRAPGNLAEGVCKQAIHHLVRLLIGAIPTPHCRL
jgi:hypothetical protein